MSQQSTDVPETQALLARLFSEKQTDELEQIDELQELATAAINGLVSKLREAHAELKSLRAFQRSVDEALNSGDGSYRP